MKKIITICLCIILLSLLCIPAIAVNTRVYDEAGLMLNYQISILEDNAAEVWDEYEIEVVILTVDDAGWDVSTYAANFYKRGDFADDGLILILSLEERDWAVEAFGEAASIFTSGRIDRIMNNVTPYFSDGQYYNGFNAFISNVRDRIIDYETNPDAEESDLWIYVAIALGVGLLVGFITISVMKSGMKTSVFQHGAHSYIRNGTYRIRQQRDIYLYSTTTRIRRSSDSSGSRGRSGSRGKF